MKIYRIANQNFYEDDIISAVFKGKNYIGKISFIHKFKNKNEINVDFKDYDKIESEYNNGEEGKIEILEWMETPFYENELNLVEKGSIFEMEESELNLNDEEEFYYGSNVWDVRKAKRLIFKNKREKQEFEVNSVKWLLESGQINVDISNKDVDLSIPLIVLANGFPIDGWHRIEKAIEEGVKTLPSYVLTEDEEKEIKDSIF
jgi:hypothetical protein